MGSMLPYIPAPWILWVICHVISCKHLQTPDFMAKSRWKCPINSGLTAAEGGRKDLFVQVQLMIHGFCHFLMRSFIDVFHDVEMFDDAFYDMFTSWELGGFCLVVLVWVPKLVRNNGAFSKSRSMRMASNKNIVLRCT